MTLYNVRVIAHLLDLTETRVRQLRDEGILTETIPGHYPLVGTVQAYVKYLRRGNSSKEEYADQRKEQALLTKAKREHAELDLEIRKNQVHYGEDVEKICLQLLLNFRQRLLAVPSKTAPILSQKTDPNDIQEILSREVQEVLEEISDLQHIIYLLEEKEDEEANA